MKDNVFRIFYTVISLLVVYLSYLYYEDVVSNGVLFQKFSYVGLVVTTIGFTVAVFEVAHSAYVTKSITQQANELLRRVKEIENASTISECISAIDETNNHVMSENYTASLCSFQNLRKLFVRLGADISEDKELLNDVEKLMFKATKTNLKAPLSKRQKDGLISSILKIKATLESLNPTMDGSE